MVYAIMIWMITMFLTIWILLGVHQTNEHLRVTYEKDLDKNRIIDYMKNRFCILFIVIILVWWISFILFESFKLNFFHYETNLSYQILVLILFSPTIFYMQSKRRKMIKEKYNICIIRNNSRMEYALALLISIVYSQILSFSIESLMMLAV
jgi:hypothetical protein